jgi:hypothetical protein
MQWRLLLSGSAALISSLFASLLACVSVPGESEWCTASSKQAVEEEEAWPTHKSGPVLDQADSMGLVDRPFVPLHVFGGASSGSSARSASSGGVG